MTASDDRQIPNHAAGGDSAPGGLGAPRADHAGAHATGGQTLQASHRRVATILVGVVAVMLGMAYASVPLYRIFCQVTGYGGTPQIAAAVSHQVVDKKIVVRFDANTSRGLPWEFGPRQHTIEVQLGENVVAHYSATNTSAAMTKGTASFNVTPDSAGAYFNKVQCFCFTEQTLKPGETADMPVMFFVDPAIMDDPDARKLSEITLSYTFYPIEEPGAKGAVKAERAGQKQGNNGAPG